MKLSLDKALYPDSHEIDMYNFAFELADLMKKYGVTTIYGNWTHPHLIPSITCDSRSITIKALVVRFKP